MTLNTSRALCSDVQIIAETDTGILNNQCLFCTVPTMPMNAETVNLAATYMILVILLFFLWLFYSAFF